MKGESLIKEKFKAEINIRLVIWTKKKVLLFKWHLSSLFEIFMQTQLDQTGDFFVSWGLKIMIEYDSCYKSGFCLIIICWQEYIDFYLLAYYYNIF